MGFNFLWISLWPRGKILQAPLLIWWSPQGGHPGRPASGKSPSILTQCKSCSQSLRLLYTVGSQGKRPWQGIATTKSGLRKGDVLWSVQGAISCSSTQHLPQILKRRQSMCLPACLLQLTRYYMCKKPLALCHGGVICPHTCPAPPLRGKGDFCKDQAAVEIPSLPGIPPS